MFKKVVVTCFFIVSGFSGLVIMNGVFVHCKTPTAKIMSIINEYSKKIKTEKNIERRVYGFGSTDENNGYDGKIHSIDLVYSIDKNLQIEEATRIFFEMADGLIAAINLHPEIGGEFYHYPISYQDLEVGLSFDYENKGHLKVDDVDSIRIRNKELMYFIVDKEGPSKVEKKLVMPGVYRSEGEDTTTRCITKPLPETK